ncbi:MAG TPA: biopolymer transporter ExbD [Terracidiphilus sp.]
MAMSMEGARSGMADMNVTPMIDILLVLLIIFMVIVPTLPHGLAAAVPQPAARDLPHHPENAIIVQVLGRKGQTPEFKINGSEVAYHDLLPRLTAIYANRADRVMFVRGDEGVDFQYIASVIDLGRAANVDRVGLITPGAQSAR